MELPPDSVTAVLASQIVTVRLYRSLHCMRNIPKTISTPYLRLARCESRRGDCQQGGSLRAHSAYGKGSGSVAVETLMKDAYIQRDNIAFVKHSRARDAVYQLSIDRSTDGCRERMPRPRRIAQERGDSALFTNPCFGISIEFASGHSWSQPLFQQR